MLVFGNLPVNTNNNNTTSLTINLTGIHWFENYTHSEGIHGVTMHLVAFPSR